LSVNIYIIKKFMHHYPT